MVLHDLGDALLCRVEKRGELILSEGLGLRRALNLDEATSGRLHDIHVHLGARIFVIVEIQQ